MQKKNYREMIRSNPKWKFCGLYVDDGFSGTETLHRPGFQRMMKDALAGKIDMIITKSVSRFARNLIDCISWVRRLKEQDPPIPVLFEQENLNRAIIQADKSISFVFKDGYTCVVARIYPQFCVNYKSRCKN